MSVEFVPQVATVSPADIPGSPVAQAFEQPLLRTRVQPYAMVQRVARGSMRTTAMRTPGADAGTAAIQGRNLGGNIEIVGSPEQVVEQLLALKRAGIDGVQLGFFDFAVDLEHYGRRILPLMKEAGLRL
jgi:alkanesulfonate monooxygenase SsuD/methylene tetrahydromethanopterin reductase-like flavin-dependent oxidoreductase (luciferase family)